jgi:hypothetical protein
LRRSLASAAAGLGVWRIREPPPVVETRLDLNTPALTDADFALSPDGRSLALRGWWAGSG